jgi:hypothetical protein
MKQLAREKFSSITRCFRRKAIGLRKEVNPTASGSLRKE